MSGRSIDDRIVSLEFQNSKFEGPAKNSIQTLGNLKNALNLPGASKGLENVQATASKFSLNNAISGVESLAGRFSTLGIIGMTVLQNLTNRAISFGAGMISKVLDPIMSGGESRSLKIEQAKFQFAGLGMDIEASMASANEAVKGTAYGLDSAARAASQFGASGMRAGEEMTSALRSIAGVAAMTGSSYDEISNIFTGIAGAGRVYTQDLMQLQGRGLNAAADIARYMREVRGETDMTEQSVRDMVTKGNVDFNLFASAMDWAFGEHATAANQTFTGALSNMNAALSRIGEKFITIKNEGLRKVFNELSEEIDKVKNALQPLVDLFQELVTASSDSLVGFLDGLDLSRLSEYLGYLADSIRNVVSFLKELAGVAVSAFKDVFAPISGDQVANVLSTIKEVTSRFTLAGESAEKVKSIFKGLFALFSIAFQIIGGVVGVLGKLLGVLSPTGSSFFNAAAGLGEWLVNLNQTMKDGKVVSTVVEAIGNAFQKIAGVIGSVISWFRNGREEIGSFSDKMKESASVGDIFAAFLGVIGRRLQSIKEAFNSARETISEFFDRIFSGTDAAGNKISSFGAKVGEILGKVKNAIKDALDNITFDRLKDLINGGLVIGIATMFMSFISKLKSGATSLNDIIGQIKSVFDAIKTGEGIGGIKVVIEGVNDAFAQMQAKLKAQTLKEIAIAIGILAASLLILSLIDSDKLAGSLGAMGMLMVSMALLTTYMNSLELENPTGLMKTAGAMVIFGVALMLMSSAVKKMGSLDWQELLKGLTGVIALLAAMAGASQITNTDSEGMIKTAASMIVFGVAVRLLAGAVRSLSQLSWEELAKGILSVAAILATMAGFSHIVKTDGLNKVSGSILILSAAMLVMAKAFKRFNDLRWEELAKGVASLAAILAVIAGFSQIVDSSGILKTSVSVVVLGAAMLVMAKAFEEISTMNWEDLAKGVASMVAVLAALAGFTAITNAGDLALSMVGFAIFAASLKPLTNALQAIGDMNWVDIAKGVATLVVVMGALAGMSAITNAGDLILTSTAITILAGAFVTLSVAMGMMAALGWEGVLVGLLGLAGVLAIFAGAAALCTPILPEMVILAGVITLLGLAVGIASLGIGVFALGLAQLTLAIIAFASLGGDAMLNIIDNITQLFGLIPLLAQSLADGFVVFITSLADNAPVIQSAFSTIIQSMLDTVNTNLPLIIDTLVNVLHLFGDAIVNNTGYIVDVAIALVLGVINGMNSRIGEIVNTATNLIINFSQALQTQFPRLNQEGANLIINFINSLADTVRNNSSGIQGAAQNLGGAIIAGLFNGIISAPFDIAGKIVEIASNAINAGKRRLGIKSPSRVFREIGNNIIAGWSKGLDQHGDDVAKSVMDVAAMALIAAKAASNQNFDISPKITPVVDLSDIESGAGLASKMLSGIDASTSLQAARSASVLTKAGSSDQNQTGGNNTSVNFVQNNTSPKALSPIEIYRNTNNQLAQIKKYLGM